MVTQWLTLWTHSKMLPFPWLCPFSVTSFQLLALCSGFYPTIQRHPCQVQQHEEWAQWWMATRPECFLLAQCMVGQAPTPCALIINRWREWMAECSHGWERCRTPCQSGFVTGTWLSGVPLNWRQTWPLRISKIHWWREQRPCIQGPQNCKNGWGTAFFHWCICTEVAFCSFMDLWHQLLLVCFRSSGAPRTRGFRGVEKLECSTSKPCLKLLCSIFLH